MGQKDVCLVQFMLDSLRTGNSISGHCIRMTQGGLPAKEDGNEAGRDELAEEKRYGDFDQAVKLDLNKGMNTRLAGR